MLALVFSAPPELTSCFVDVRRQLDIPVSFSDEVLAEAEASTVAMEPRLDARHLEFVAIDPPGATDLDQAYHAKRDGDGYVVHYAIADVAAFVKPGGAIDVEAKKRGTTLYSPDKRSPLHPRVISEDRASLLAGGDKPALLWTIRLDSDGEPVSSKLVRAMVKVREAISYTEAQARIDGGDGTPGWSESLDLLRTIGMLRREREAERGGISLNLPSQEVVKTDHGYALEFDSGLPVEDWNAQISLLTGIVAGQAMADAKVGILRTLPSPNDYSMDKLRKQARALDVDWPTNVSYADFIRTVIPDSANRSAFMLKAARSLRGAGYVGFNGELPEHPEHGAIASIYSHVTAPLRRLVDRFGNEILLSLHAGHTPPAWALEALEELPSLMGRARSKESALEREMVALAEAAILEPHVGQEFDAFVIDLNKKRDYARIQIREPAVLAEVPFAERDLAETVRVKLVDASIDDRTVSFEVV